MSLFVVPIDFREANALVEKLHRHHQPAQGHRFSLGVVDESGELHAAAIVGRPVARLAGNPQHVAEVTRLVTDGTKNCCSMLYSAAARSAKEMGFCKIQTYILADEETGVSLKASGWVNEGIAGGGSWAKSRPGRREDQPMGKKVRWSKRFRDETPIALPIAAEVAGCLSLFLEVEQ